MQKKFIFLALLTMCYPWCYAVGDTKTSHDAEEVYGPFARCGTNVFKSKRVRVVSSYDFSDDWAFKLPIEIRALLGYAIEWSSFHTRSPREHNPIWKLKPWSAFLEKDREEELNLESRYYVDAPNVQVYGRIPEILLVAPRDGDADRLSRELQTYAFKKLSYYKHLLNIIDSKLNIAIPCDDYDDCRAIAYNEVQRLSTLLYHANLRLIRFTHKRYGQGPMTDHDFALWITELYRKCLDKYVWTKPYSFSTYFITHVKYGVRRPTSAYMTPDRSNYEAEDDGIGLFDVIRDVDTERFGQAPARLVRQEVVEAVQEALKELSPAEYEVLALKWGMNGTRLSYLGISKELNMPDYAVRRLESDARRKITRSLEALSNDSLK